MKEKHLKALEKIIKAHVLSLKNKDIESSFNELTYTRLTKLHRDVLMEECPSVRRDNFIEDILLTKARYGLNNSKEQRAVAENGREV